LNGPTRRGQGSSWSGILKIRDDIKGTGQDGQMREASGVSVQCFLCCYLLISGGNGVIYEIILCLCKTDAL